MRTEGRPTPRTGNEESLENNDDDEGEEVEIGAPPVHRAENRSEAPVWWRALKILAIPLTIIPALFFLYDRLSSCVSPPPRFTVEHFDVYMIVPEVPKDERSVTAQLGALLVLRNLDEKRYVRVEGLSYQGKIGIEGAGGLHKLFIGPYSRMVGDFAAAPASVAVVPIELDSEIIYSGKGEGITLGFPGSWIATINGETVRIKARDSYRGTVTRAKWSKLVKTPRALLSPLFYRPR